jgi:hypothetical protein
VDGQLLADGGQIWKISNGSLLTSLPGAATRPARSSPLEIGAFSPSSNFLLWASKNGAAVWGLPESYSPGQLPNLVTHVVREKETLFNTPINIRQSWSQPGLNRLTCQSPIFSGQHVLIPGQPEDLLIPSEMLCPITAENVKNIQRS